jgi:hypothetical protein
MFYLHVQQRTSPHLGKCLLLGSAGKLKTYNPASKRFFPKKCLARMLIRILYNSTEEEPLFVDCSSKSSKVKAKREPSNSSLPSRSHFTLYCLVTCLPIIVMFFGRSSQSFSTFSEFFVIKSDLRLFIRYLIATFLCTWPSTGICSFPVSIVN